MNWATLITEYRSFTWATSANLSDTLALIDLNKSYHYIEDCITEIVWESFFYNEVTTDDPTVAWQKEYTIYFATAWNLDGTNKLLGVSIDYGDGIYTKATKVDMQSLDKDFSWYAEHQPTSDPIYTIQDNSIMIFPVPTASTVGYIRMYIIQNLIDLTASTAESDIFNGKIHKKYHPLIALGAEQYGYQRRQMFDKAQESEIRFHWKLFWEYVNGKYAPWMLDLINTRQRGARIRQMPAWYNVPN